MNMSAITSVEQLRYAVSPRSEENVRIIKRLNHLMMKNIQSLFEDTDADKEIIFDHIYDKAEKVKKSENVVFSTGKNLIYFSIFTDDYFVQMLDICLDSIRKTTNLLNFDILFITDVPTSTKIKNLQSVKYFNCKYLLLDVPSNGIEASFNKLQIIKFSELNNYDKVLYLDTDILCMKDLNALFDLPLVSGKLHVRANQSKHMPCHFALPTNGVLFLNERAAQFILDHNDLVPFNAGQYIFKNCSHIQEHIKNVLWMAEVWPGMHFFEQSFMNTYFCIHDLTESVLLSFLVEIASSPTEYPTTKPSSAPVRAYLSNDREKKQLVVVNALDSKFTKKEVTKGSLPTFVESGVRIRDKAEEMTFKDTVKTTYTDLGKKHTDQTILLHFAGWSINGRQKMHFMHTYCDAHQLSI